jgi:hypothetical protein
MLTMGQAKSSYNILITIAQTMRSHTRPLGGEDGLGLGSEIVGALGGKHM